MPITGLKMTTSEPLEPVYRKLAERFEKCLRPSSYPLAVKMLEREEDIPKLAKRPLGRPSGYGTETLRIGH